MENFRPCRFKTVFSCFFSLRDVKSKRFMELEDDFQFRPKSDEIDYSLLSVYYTISSSAGDTVGQGEAGKGRELVTLVTGTRYRGRQFCIKENGVADGGRCLTNAGPVLLARRTFATLVAKSGTNGTSVFLFFFFMLLPARSLPGLCNISTGIFILHEAKALIKGKKYYIYILYEL